MPKRRANGEGSITQRKDGLWMAQYTDCDGVRRSLYGKTQQIVKNKLKEAIKKSDMGVVADSKKITFIQWIYEWLDIYIKPTTRAVTYSRYHGIITRHIDPYFSKTQLNDLRADMLQKYFSTKTESGRRDNIPGGLSPAELRKHKDIINGALKKAVEIRLITFNPCTSVQLPQSIRGEKQILTVEEQERLEQEIAKDKNPLSFGIFLSLYTGLRIGEIIALMIDDINFEKKTLTVKRTAANYRDTNTGKIIHVINDPKTEKSRREIPLPDFIIDMLINYIADRERLIEAVKGNWRGFDAEKAANWKDPGFLFISGYGDKTTSCNMNQLLARLLKQAKIKRITFHSLRHTFATRCIEKGFDVKSLSDILGHTDAKMTLNTYTHALESQKRTNMERLTPLWKNGKSDVSNTN